MKYTNINWPFKWFGVWSEYGLGYENYPSIKDFISPHINERYKKDALISYLDNGVIVTSTSRNNFPSPINGEIKMGTISFRTDGEWLWLDNISDLIINNGLIIPDAWYLKIENNSFKIPKVDENNLERIEWPSL